MKTLILILLMVPLFGLSQTSPHNEKSTAGNSLINSDNSSLDTIPVLILVSDTSRIKSNSEVIIYEGIENGRPKYQRQKTYFGNNSCYYIRGFEVLRKYYDGFAPDFLKYLDSEKKPLKPGIVVWNKINRK